MSSTLLNVHKMVEKDILIPSPYKDADLPKIHNYNFGAYLLSTFEKYGDKVAETYYHTGEELTYMEIRVLAKKFSNYLMKAGFNVGDVISIVRNHSNDHISLVLGTLQMGIGLYPLHTALTTDEFVYRLDLVGPKRIFVDEDCSERVKIAVDLLKSRNSAFEWSNVDVVIVSSLSNLLKDISNVIEEINGSNFWYFKFLVCTGLRYYLKVFKGISFDAKNWMENDVPEFDVDATVSFILLSSGTTGMPKAVKLSHKSFLVREAQLRYMLKAASQNSILNEFIKKDKGFPVSTIVFHPNSHMTGNIVLFLALIMGGHVIIANDCNERDLLTIIEKYKVSQLGMTPYLLQRIAKSSLIEEFNVSSVMKLYCGASQLHLTTKTAIHEKLKLRVCELYGQTESGSSVVSEEHIPLREGSIGKLLPYVTAKIICLETGKSLGPGKDGELCFKTPSMMLGYASDPEQTRAVIDEDGWCHTGDVMCYDEDGYIYFIDRIKDFIEVGSTKVAPKEVEMALLSHDDIEEACVVGVPLEMSGEVPKAFVVPKRGAKVTPSDLFQHIKTRLAEFKHPTGGIEIVGAIPRNQTGKPMRHLLISK